MAMKEGPAAPAPRSFACRIVELAHPARDTTVVRLEPTAGGALSFAAGQYVTVAFPGLPPRDYSLANRPGDPVIELHIRDFARPGRRTLAERLRVGDRVAVEGPFGDSWLRERHAGPILVVAGGSGIAPAISIVETALAKEMAQDIHLYLGVRDEQDLYCGPRFHALADSHPNLHFVPVLSEPEGPTRERTGLVHEAVAEDFTDLSGVKAYVAGPPPMVRATVDTLLTKGMAAPDIHSDSHTPAGSGRAPRR